MKKFTISMLALDGIEMSRACITSIIQNSTPGAFHLFLTNNGSKDGTKEYFDELSEKHDFITVIHNEKNEVFIAPNNKVFELAKYIGSTYHILVNNDIVVPAGWLEGFEKVFSENLKAAVVGPQGTISHVNERMCGYSRAKFEYVEGSCFCAKVDVVGKFGPLFSDYLTDIYYDDLDCCLRMQRAGYTIHQADFHVQHRNGSTCQRHPEAIRRCKEANAKNQNTMLKKWAHWNRVRRFDFPILVRRKFAVGDVLLTTPIIKALKETWPLCPIDVETLHVDLFKDNPYVRTAAQSIRITPQTWVINLDGCYERSPGVHVLESYAKAAGVHPLNKPRLDYYGGGMPPIPMCQENDKWCAVHVGPTTWPAKNWPMDRWAEIIRYLRGMGWKVLLLGNKSNDKLEFDLDLRGQKGIQELFAHFIPCLMFVGLDSFPAHAATACNLHCVVLYGITNPDCFKVSTAPYIAVKSDPKHKDTGRRNKIPNITFLQAPDHVMRTISVDQVKAAIDQILTIKDV